MWLPRPVYEALPLFYVVIGSIMVAGVAYIGFNVRSMPFYLIVGILCIAFGVLVQHLRLRARAPAESAHSKSAAVHANSTATSAQPAAE